MEEGADATAAEVKLCQELASLFRVMWSGKWAVVTPYAIVDQVWRLVPSFRGYMQQDAQELLCELQDRIDAELNQLSKAFETQRVPPPAGLRLLFAALGGELVSRVRCMTCHHVSSTIDPFCDLPLDFHGSDRNSFDLSELLQNFVATEELEGGPVSLRGGKELLQCKPTDEDTNILTS